MLTDKDREWLEGKSDADYPAPCVRTGKRGLFDMRYCLRACEGNSASSPKYCPIASDFRDAAEFEARVARSLAIFRHINQDDFYNLKRARLAVEAEMEQEGK